MSYGLQQNITFDFENSRALAWVHADVSFAGNDFCSRYANFVTPNFYF